MRGLRCGPRCWPVSQGLWFVRQISELAMMAFSRRHGAGWNISLTASRARKRAFVGSFQSQSEFVAPVRLLQSAADRCDVGMAVEFYDRLLQELNAWNHVRGSVSMGFGDTSEQAHAFEITCRSNELHFSAWAMRG